MGSMRVDDLAALFDWEQLEQHAQVVRYDARGHGNSDGSYDPEDYRWEEMAGDMLAIADSVASTFAAGRCVLAGVSMGAATALEAATQQPDKVAGMILVLPPTAWDTRPRQAAIYRRMSWISGLFGAGPYRMLDWLPIPVRDDGRSRLALYTAKGLARANPLHVQAALRGAALSDMPDRATLAKLKVPTLILAWENDMAHPVSTAEALAESLPDVRKLDVISPHDQPDWTRLVCEFLQELGSAAQKPKKKVRSRRRTAA
jgi:pimeloyl-ACP methyl ester carboxylesterase